MQKAKEKKILEFVPEKCFNSYVHSILIFFEQH